MTVVEYKIILVIWGFFSRWGWYKLLSYLNQKDQFWLSILVSIMKVLSDNWPWKFPRFLGIFSGHGIFYHYFYNQKDHYIALVKWNTYLMLHQLKKNFYNKKLQTALDRCNKCYKFKLQYQNPFKNLGTFSNPRCQKTVLGW